MQNPPKLIHVNRIFEPSNTQVLSSISNYQQSIVLDVSDVQKTSISALNLILEIQKKLTDHGQALTLLKPSACIRTWLYITKLHSIIPSFPNLSMANAYIQDISSDSDDKSKIKNS